MKVNRCQIEILDGEFAYEGKPTDSPRDDKEVQVGKLRKFRVTTTDTLNHIFGLIEWPNARPEVRSIERIDGLEKYKRLEEAGRLTFIPRGETWLADVRALRFNGKPRPTLAGVSDLEIEELTGEKAEQFFKNIGCIAYGTRAQLVGDESPKRNQMAVVMKAGDLEAIAKLFTATRVMAIMFDLGTD